MAPCSLFLNKYDSRKTWYKTHNQELLPIIEAFKTWHYYLNGCKFEVLVLTDHNNLDQFMDIKKVSFRQVRWAQELSWYHFQINNYQDKANVAADTLSCFLQKSQSKEDKLQAKNI